MCACLLLAHVTAFVSRVVGSVLIKKRLPTVRETWRLFPVDPPKVSQRRAQPCAAVRRRIGPASSRAMINGPAIKTDNW